MTTLPMSCTKNTMWNPKRWIRSLNNDELAKTATTGYCKLATAEQKRRAKRAKKA